MITIIHGDNVTESREQFFWLKSEMQNSINIEGASLDQNQLLNFFESSDMFLTEKNLAIENFLSKNKPSKKLDEIIEIVNKYSKNTNILFWEEKEITKKSLSQFPHAKILIFNLPKIIFNFLDAISPGNGSYLVRLFEQLSKNTSIEIVLYMLVRQFRLLIAFSSKNVASIDEAVRMAPWQSSKIQNQASKFDIDHLKKLYKRLYEIDLGSKTGKLNMPITSAIDIFLVSI